MGLDDFDSIPPSLRPSGAEDEDLFNFPAVDLSGQAAPAPVTPSLTGPIPSPLPPPSAPPTPARAPIHAPAQTPARITPVPSTPPSARTSPPSPAVDKPAEDVQRAPLPSTKPVARKTALTSVEPDPIAPQEPELDEVPAQAVRSMPRAARSRAVWLVIVVALNVAGFAVLWVSNRSYRTGLEGLRDDLVVTMHDLRRSASESASSVQAARTEQRSEPIPESAASSVHPPGSPLAPHEETTLLLARQEIEEGEHVQARKRLFRLLALADRIDAELRQDIEARALYLVGDSYRDQAQARREAQP